MDFSTFFQGVTDIHPGVAAVAGQVEGIVGNMADPSADIPNNLSIPTPITPTTDTTE